MQTIQKILGFIKSHKIIAFITIVALAGFVYYRFTHSSKAQAVRYVTAAAANQTITVSVDGTGQIAASNQIDLKPQSSGTLTSVNVKQGQEIKAGTVVATLDERAASTQITQARASLEQAQANYEKLIAGLGTDDQTLAQFSVTSAQRSVDKAKTDYANAIVTQQQNVDAAFTALMNNDLTLAANNLLSSSSLTLSGTYTGTAPGSINVSTYQTGNGLYYSVSGIASASGLISPGIAQSLGSGLYLTFGTTGTISTSTTWTVDIPNVKSSSYQTKLTAYHNAQTTQAQTLQQDQTAIATAQDNLTQAQIQFKQKIAPAAQSDLDSAKAQIAASQASLATAQTNYSNNIIIAPFDGVIAKLSLQRGDQASASTAVATLVTKQQIAQISLNEVDAVNVKQDQKATMTFDAIESLSMTGKVVEIDTIGTVSQGVVSYSAKVALDTQDDRIKPGMSVNVSIITDVAPDVLAVPSSAVKSDANGNYVQMLNSGTLTDVAVETGLSNDSVTQIKSGLTSGEEVVSQTITPSKTTPATAGSSTVRIPGITGGATGGFTGRAGATGAGR